MSSFQQGGGRTGASQGAAAAAGARSAKTGIKSALKGQGYEESIKTLAPQAEALVRPGAKPQDPRSFYEKLDFSNGALDEQSLDRAAELPGEAKAAFEYYLKNVEEQDWGSVRAYRFTTGEGQVTYAVDVTTDGDDGWIEVFTEDGKPIASGRTGLEDDGQGGYKQSYAWDAQFGASRKETNP